MTLLKMEKIKQFLAFIKFKSKYYKVRVINPLKVGTYFSQVGQDVYLSALLFKMIEKQGVKTIIDIGCNHPINFSNSYFFEKYYDFTTLAFDPIAEYKELWTTLRPKAFFSENAIGDFEGSVILNIPERGGNFDDMFSSLDKDNQRLKDEKTIECVVPCRTLGNILKEQDISEILFVSIDVEGFELQVLKGIDFDAVKISCFIIENNSKNLYGSNEIRDLLLSKGYIFKTRILCFDDVFVHESLIGQI